MPYKIRDVIMMWTVLLGCLAVVAVPVVAQNVSSGGSDTRQAPDTNTPFREAQPEGCVQVPPIIDYLASGGHPDALIYGPSRDTVSRVARIQVGQCAVVYGGSTTKPWQLLNAARTDLLLGRDTDARTLAGRYLSTLATTDLGHQAWGLYLVIADLADATPPRLEAARQMLAALDRLGAPAARERVLAHAAMTRAGNRLFDDTLARNEANGAIAAAWQMTEDERQLVGGELADVFLRKGELELRLRGGAIARGVMDTAVVLVPPGPPRRSVSTARHAYQFVDQPALPVDAQLWFGRTGPAVKPAQGVVTILSHIRHDCSTGCQDRIMELRRLATRFAGQPVEQVHLSQTQGFYRDSAPVSPAEEARDDSTYYYGFAKLSGTLAMYITKYGWRSDHRRRDEPTPQETNYPAAIWIVDKRGIVRYADIRYDNELEELRARFIARLLAE